MHWERPSVMKSTTRSIKPYMRQYLQWHKVSAHADACRLQAWAHFHLRISFPLQACLHYRSQIAKRLAVACQFYVCPTPPLPEACNPNVRADSFVPASPKYAAAANNWMTSEPPRPCVHSQCMRCPALRAGMAAWLQPHSNLCQPGRQSLAYPMAACQD